MREARVADAAFPPGMSPQAGCNSVIKRQLCLRVEAGRSVVGCFEIGPQYFREAAEVITAAAGGPPDRAKMAEIMRRHGLTPAPPPPQA